MFNRHNPILLATHRRTGNTYFIIHQQAELKDPSSGEWLQSVLYTDNVNVYCRERGDFETKFTIREVDWWKSRR